ncbi:MULTISPECIES: hypothetical protein [Staphylococcus]|uniref:hypothetical protein n=1 Tax=Staphylococcus TaxID=1279 RepID=UPI000920DC96|nr:hypothetical protein [Staphylococcus argenteus]SGX29973.1 Uncharacterised protein [Staphylococcus argenteus]
MSLSGKINEFEMGMVDLNEEDRNVSNRLLKDQKRIIILSYILFVIWLVVTFTTAFSMDMTARYKQEFNIEMKFLEFIILILMILGNIFTCFYYEKSNHDIGKILKSYTYIKDGAVILEVKNYNYILGFVKKNKRQIKSVDYKTTWSLYMYIATAFNIILTGIMVIFTFYH